MAKRWKENQYQQQYLLVLTVSFFFRSLQYHHQFTLLSSLAVPSSVSSFFRPLQYHHQFPLLSSLEVPSSVHLPLSSLAAPSSVHPTFVPCSTIISFPLLSSLAVPSSVHPSFVPCSISLPSPLERGMGGEARYGDVRLHFATRLHAKVLTFAPRNINHRKR